MTTEIRESSREAGLPLQVRDAADGLLVPEDAETSPVLSFVIPTKNEMEAIAECIERCKRVISDLAVSSEIIVSDSSTDQTPAIAAEMGAIVVSPDRSGYGHAYRYAFQFVRGQYVVIGDADMTYDFTELPALLELVDSGEADMALGNRLDGDIETGAMPFLHQYVGNPALTWILNRLYGVGVGDAHSGFRVMTREALDELEFSTGGMEFASEMLIEADQSGLAIEETPITYRERRGEATLDTFGDGWRHVRFMLLNAPRYLFVVPGWSLVTAGLLVMLAASLDVTVATVDLGLRSMVVGSLMTVVGYQVTQFGAYTSLAGDPIQTATDPVTNWLVDSLSLERGLMLGSALLLGGCAYAVGLSLRWSNGALSMSPLLLNEIVAFTAITLGVQTMFSSFLMSTLAEQRS